MQSVKQRRRKKKKEMSSKRKRNSYRQQWNEWQESTSMEYQSKRYDNRDHCWKIFPNIPVIRQSGTMNSSSISGSSSGLSKNHILTYKFVCISWRWCLVCRNVCRYIYIYMRRLFFSLMHPNVYRFSTFSRCWCRKIIKTRPKTPQYY